MGTGGTVGQPSVQIVVLAAQHVDLLAERGRCPGVDEQSDLFLGRVHLQQAEELPEDIGCVGPVVQGRVHGVAELEQTLVLGGELGRGPVRRHPQ